MRLNDENNRKTVYKALYDLFIKKREYTKMEKFYDKLVKKFTKEHIAIKYCPVVAEAFKNELENIIRLIADNDVRKVFEYCETLGRTE